MRLIDDYIFVSTSEAEARRFMHIIHSDMHRPVFRLNKSKTQTNITDVHGVIKFGIADAWFPWCGIELNTSDLSVRPSFRR
jgi:hypothetical protein